MKPFLKVLGFELTNAQKRALHDILCDISGVNSPEKNDNSVAFTSPARRLVQGDVGSGKTAVAFGAIYACAKSGF